VALRSVSGLPAMLKAVSCIACRHLRDDLAELAAAVNQLMARYSKAEDRPSDPRACAHERVWSVVDDGNLAQDEAQRRVGSYRLSQYHLGAVLRASGTDPELRPQTSLFRIADTIAATLKTSNALSFFDDATRSGCVWFPLGERTEIDVTALAAALAEVGNVSIAFGDIGFGLPGFRRTHRQALSANAVARVNDVPLPRLIWFAEVAPIAMMAADIELAKAWVAETLGELAFDGERQAMLRETARVYFETGRSYTATAKQLFLHRNTAHYRVRAAEEMRGRPFHEGRLEVELALLASRWFGAAVLQQPQQPEPRSN
jgi:DNA-binding PucR family transcriptional regulator